MEQQNNGGLGSRIRRNLATIALGATIVGCAGLERQCSSCSAENFASDWVIVQYDYAGDPMNCWRLPDTSVANEPESDGIYWLDGQTGHLVHLSGWYNRVQVEGGRWDEAAQSIGIDLARCVGGPYQSE